MATGSQGRRGTPARLLAAGLLAAALGLGCIDPTPMGNFMGTCPQGTVCSCDLIGNCTYDCPGGNCTLRCDGMSNCFFSCAGGGCQMECQNVGNCINTCSGNGCSMTCTGTGNCSLSGCTSGCTRDCRNLGTCT